MKDVKNAAMRTEDLTERESHGRTEDKKDQWAVQESKAEGLTEAELKEQKLLRAEYLEAVKQNLRRQLNNIDIEEKDGTVINLGEKYGSKDEDKRGN